MSSNKFLIKNLSAINDVQDTDLVLMERGNTSYKSQFYNFDHLKNLSVENGIINKLTVDDKGDIIEFINSSIEHNAAFYVTRDAEGHPFANYSELSTATNSLSSKLSDEWELYIGGVKKRPSQNDYCVVLSDESLPEEYKHGELSIQYTTRYSWAETSDSNLSGRWEFKYVINNSPYTKVQWDTINSGITKDTVVKRESNKQVGNPTLPVYVDEDGTVKTTPNISVTSLTATDSNISSLTTTNEQVSNLTSNTGNITDLTSVNSNISNLNITHISANGKELGEDWTFVLEDGTKIQKTVFCYNKP